jgi:hypothetical protein
VQIVARKRATAGDSQPVAANVRELLVKPPSKPGRKKLRILLAHDYYRSSAPSGEDQVSK